jgi:hypothetical protein
LGPGEHGSKSELSNHVPVFDTVASVARTATFWAPLAQFLSSVSTLFVETGWPDRLNGRVPKSRLAALVAIETVMHGDATDTRAFTLPESAPDAGIAEDRAAAVATMALVMRIRRVIAPPQNVAVIVTDIDIV